MPDYPKIARQGLRDITELDNRPWRGSQWIGADHSAMGVRPDGTVIVGCGDTFVNGVINDDGTWDGGFTNNSLLWWKGGAFGVEYSKTVSGLNIFGGPAPYFPGILTPYAGFRWPRSCWFELNDNRMHMMTQDFEGNIFDGYTSRDVREYVLNDDFTFVSSAQVPGVVPQDVPAPDESNTPYEVTWGQAVVIDPLSNYTYIFGAWRRFVSYRLVVCRRLANFGNLPGNVPDFWDGATWSSDMQDIAVIGASTGPLGNSFSVIPHPGGGWLMTSCGIFSANIGAWHADAMEGPWTDLGTVYAVPAEFPGQWNYGGHSYIADNGKLRICYSLNNGTVPLAIRANYQRYGVRWAEVDVPARP